MTAYYHTHNSADLFRDFIRYFRTLSRSDLDAGPPLAPDSAYVYVHYSPKSFALSCYHTYRTSYIKKENIHGYELEQCFESCSDNLKKKENIAVMGVMGHIQEIS